MPEPNRLWTLDSFTARLDEWTDLESPHDELRLTVTAWVLSRFEDPYFGARREPGFPNLWYAVVPGTRHDDSVVVCSFWIEESNRLVRCDRFGTLAWPID